jgi:hypothetical protein
MRLPRRFRERGRSVNGVDGQKRIFWFGAGDRQMMPLIDCLYPGSHGDFIPESIFRTPKVVFYVLSTEQRA